MRVKCEGGEEGRDGAHINNEEEEEEEDTHLSRAEEFDKDSTVKKRSNDRQLEVACGNARLKTF